jgi:FkbM family methyltransferase
MTPVFGLARRTAGRIRRALKQRLSAPKPPPRSPWEDEDTVFRRIAALRPDVVLDIGANTGQFVDRLRKGGYTGRVISFEPQGSVFEALKKRVEAAAEWECHRLALGDAASTLAMHVSAFSPSSSLLPIGKLHVDLMPQTAEIGVETVQVIRLDQWPEAVRLADRRLFMKIDVQGYELPVLRGMGSLLLQVDGALVELNFSPLFDGQSKYWEVMGALEAAGLRFVGLTGVQLHARSADFLWADAFFVRRPSAS